MAGQSKLKRPAAAADPKRSPKKKKEKSEEREAPEKADAEATPAKEEQQEKTETASTEKDDQPEEPEQEVKTSPKKRPAAKVSAKAAAKAVKKKEKKEKKNKEETGETKQPKAKAKSKTLREQTKSWREKLNSSTAKEDDQQDEEEEEEEEEQENEEDETPENQETRDFNKARKFNKMLSKGQIPAEVMKLYEDAASKSPKPRLFRTQLINRLFKKSSSGEYVLSTGDNAFQSWVQSVDKKFATSEQVGIPYSVMLWQIFQGNTAAMADAEKKGDVHEKDGMWYHGRVTAGRTKENQQSMQLDGGRTKLSVDEFADMQGHFMKRPWSQYGAAVADEAEAPPQASGPSSGSGVSRQSNLRMLEDRPTVQKPEVIPWKKVEAVVNDAKGANERLMRDTSRYVNKIRGIADAQDLVDQVKEVMQKLTENLQKLSDCQCWQEIPGTNMEKNSVNNYMSKVADQTDQCNEKLEQIKATCKARGLWAGQGEGIQRTGSSGTRL